MHIAIFHVHYTKIDYIQLIYSAHPKFKINLSIFHYNIGIDIETNEVNQIFLILSSKNYDNLSHGCFPRYFKPSLGMTKKNTFFKHTF